MGETSNANLLTTGIYSEKDYYVCNSASMGEFIPAVV